MLRIQDIQSSYESLKESFPRFAIVVRCFQNMSKISIFIFFYFASALLLNIPVDIQHCKQTKISAKA